MDYENRVDGAAREQPPPGASPSSSSSTTTAAPTIPPDETNGNNPVSRYKVATDAWRQLDEVARRTGDARFAETRDLVATLLPTGRAGQHPRPRRADDRPLPDRPEPRYRRQDPGQRRAAARSSSTPTATGRSSSTPNSPIAEMQTGESLYALALAGLPADHPAVRKGVLALLSAQKPFGGWLDLDPYEQFRTPFRETQWALIALSRLYPGPGTQRLGRPARPAARRALADDPADARLIRDLERDLGPARRRRCSGELWRSSSTTRTRWCATPRAGRWRGSADAGALAAVAARLGDESKVVQRAAAEAVRSIGNRALAGVEAGRGVRSIVPGRAVARALASADDRTRRGATRVFAAHFRDIAQETALADSLLERLDDPDPVVRMQAIKGLWRWWYWRPELALRNRIEDALIARLAVPEHPWVRRNLIEALYIIGDENIRYLYNNWVPSLAQARDPRPRDRGPARHGEPAGREVRGRPGGRQRAPARGGLAGDVGVLRAAGAGRPDRQRPGADALLRRARSTTSPPR